MRLQIMHDCQNQMMLHDLLIFEGFHFVKPVCRGGDGGGDDGDGSVLDSFAAGNLSEAFSWQPSSQSRKIF